MPSPDDDGCFGRMSLFVLMLLGACYIVYKLF